MANIVEIFSSIQGEGLYVGTRQVFVRFSGCNLSCAYCDTPDAHYPCQYALVERNPGKREFDKIANNITVEQLAQMINFLLSFRHHSVSLTGGEPLSQAQAIVTLAPKLHGRIYLETNGTMVDELLKVLPYIHIISMDIKLPSIAGKTYWQEHGEFLRIAATKEVFVKLVITDKTNSDEFTRAIDLIASVNTDIPLILQPVTPRNTCKAIDPDAMLTYQAQALESLKHVRVIPQTHKFMGQL